MFLGHFSSHQKKILTQPNDWSLKKNDFSNLDFFQNFLYEKFWPNIFWSKNENKKKKTKIIFFCWKN